MTDKQEQANDEEVICPACVHQFRAIPVNVQRLMIEAGFEPPFLAAPPAQPAPAQIRPSDVHVDIVMNGLGGFAPIQTSGVRLTHIPTGIWVQETDERSQHRNRDVAWGKLEKLVAAQPAPAQRLSDARLKDIANGLNGHHPMLGQWQRDKLMRDAIEAALVPSGYVVVPVEPTYEMAQAGSFACLNGQDIYRAMLEAAKTTP